MKTAINLNSYRQLLFSAIVVLVAIAAGNIAAAAQGKYKVGDRVECDTVGNGNGWRKGTIVAFQEDDGYNGYAPDSGYFYRVMIFAHDPKGQFCKSENMRMQAKATPAENLKKPDADQKNDTRVNDAENPPTKFKPGDRVECDKALIGDYEKGTVMPFRKTDFMDGERYRVRMDGMAGVASDGLLCRVTHMRLIGGGKPSKPDKPDAKVTEDEDGTLSADRPILACPVAQTPSRNGSAPNAEVIKKAFRCQAGEKPASKGLDGAVTIDVSALQVGSPRLWDRLRDMGGGVPGKTTVYPLKITYTEKTFYRAKTMVIDRVYILNYFVNGLGEWRYGSGEEIKSSGYRDIPRDQ